MASANSGDINLVSGMFFRCTLNESQRPPVGYSSPFGYGIIISQTQNSEIDKRYVIDYLVQKSTGNEIIRCVLKKLILGVTNTLYLVSTDMNQDNFEQIFNFEMAADDSVIPENIRGLLNPSHDEYTDYDNSQGSSQGSSYYDSSQGSSQGSFYYPKELGGGKRSRKRKNNTKRRKSRKSKRRRNKKSKRR